MAALIMFDEVATAVERWYCCTLLLFSTLLALGGGMKLAVPRDNPL